MKTEFSGGVSDSVYREAHCESAVSISVGRGENFVQENLS